MNKRHRIARVLLILPPCLVDSTIAQKQSAAIQVGSRQKMFSPDLFDIFFEDLNYAADEGLYPERVQNRSFEYSRGDNRNWNSLTASQLLQSQTGTAEIAVETEHPLNANNPHYAVLTIKEAGDRNGLSNKGFESTHARNPGETRGEVCRDFFCSPQAQGGHHPRHILGRL